MVKSKKGGSQVRPSGLQLSQCHLLAVGPQKSPNLLLSLIFQFHQMGIKE